MLYEPGGYPRLGLAPVSMALRWDPRATSIRLRERLERWEQHRGSSSFEARHLDRLPPALAYELANVYVSLRERYPQVRPHHVDFASPHARSFEPLGCAEPYPQLYPTLHRLACEIGATSVDEIVLVDLDIHDRAAARREAKALRSRSRTNLSTSGTIELSPCFGHPRCYRGLLDHWGRRNASAAARHRPPRYLPSHLSAASFVLTHEFGHLVDGCLLAQSDRAARKVYGALSTAAFPDELSRPPHAARWTRHLLNYPAVSAAWPGPAAGGTARARITRRVLKDRLAHRFGSYAPTSREELFAEAFALAHSARDRQLRADLVPLRRALVDVGVARSRRA
jgi:hypothetical protein